MTRNLSVMTRVSSLAIAAALTASAAAQSLLGDPTVTFGSVNISEGVGTSDFDVLSTTAVIDWTPDDNAVGNFGAIAFQQSGTTATYSSSSDFAVLNRINVADPSRMVGLDGTINSLVSGQTGGSIFFYSPSGFVIGSNAVINVGSLVLSASPIAVDGNGNFISGTTVTFNQAPNPSAAVTTVAGSQITALNEGSYVALVAPRVEHHGNINVNGAAALVGAEAATINFRAGGLFDIQVDIGTTDANGVVADGTITGPASTGGGDNHRAYLVAVPKNDALTMLIGAGANLGFDIAGAADVVGNAVVLSAGHDISFGDTSSAPSAASGADADFSIGNANFTSALYGRANGDALAGAVDGSLTFASDVSLRGRDTVRLEAGGGGFVTVGGNLTMSANASGMSEGESASAGDVTLQASAGGSLSVTGDTNLTAIGAGGFSSTPGIASGDGTGGIILVQSTSGGDMALGGALDADASGYGGSFFGDIDGGDGFGGTVNVFTSGGSSMSVAGSAFLRADGQAGTPSDCFCGGLGGIGDGGTVNVQAHSLTGNTMDFGDVLFIWASGYGGDSHTGNGGLGSGGNVSFSSSDGSVVTVATDVSITAEGVGGDAFGGVGNGGDGIGGGSGGGNVQSFAATGGSLQITGSFITNVDGQGGQSESGTGGSGTGGLGQLFATGGGDVSVGGLAAISASGRGGDGLIGGAGTGGRPLNGGGAYFSSSSGGSLTFTGFADLSATGVGGSAFNADNLGGDAGVGQGGHVEAYASAGTLAFNNALFLDAGGEGGSAGALGASSGDGFGGDVYLQAIAGGTLTVAQSLFAFADGTGGSPNFGVYSGNGTGGTITVASRDGTSSLTVSGPAFLEADGYAGFFSECSTACSNGGIGQGGDIFIASTGVLTGATLDFNATLFASANGYGGDSAIIDFDNGTTVDGGEGLGGTVSLYANDGNSLNVTGEVVLEAIGYGGYDPVDLVGGSGTGGIVQISSNGAAGNLITLGSTVVLDASGYGGDSGQSANGDGGDGFGGTARVTVAGGSLDIATDLTLTSIGYGGNTFGGTGGDGTGNLARINAVGGDIDIGGTATVDASGVGGSGAISGDGTGGGDFFTSTGGAHIFAQNGDITIGSAVVRSDGIGGNGSSGGDGGDGTGGWASIHAGNGNAGPSSITVQGVESSAYVSASGFGGHGGDGLAGIDGEGGGTGTNGGAGTDGGEGGTGSGGVASITAGAGNGTLDLGLVSAFAWGVGGNGGDGGNGGIGGNGDGGAGGNGGSGGIGGAGGAAVGGLATVGVQSGAAQALADNLGSADLGFVEIDASAFGGDGGAGGLGGAAGSGTPNGVAGTDGNGGAGGFANGGSAYLVAEGGLVDLSSAMLTANATGGDGGSGAVAGIGGDAESDEVGVIVADRFGDGTQRGELTAGNIVGTVIAGGGTGSTAGASMMEGGSSFIVENGDATIGSVDFTIIADGLIPDLAADSIAVVNGSVVVSGAFNFTTSGQASVYADNGTLNAASFNVTADNFVHDPARGFPALVGTISANNIVLTTNQDLIVDAHLVSLNGVGFTAPGLIDLENVTSTNGPLALTAGTTVTAGDLSAGNLVAVNAGGDIALGGVAANGGQAIIQSTDGGISAGAINAGTFIGLNAPLGIATGDLNAGDFVSGQSDGPILTGNIVAGTTIDLFSTGGGIATGDLTGTEIDLEANGDISFANVDADSLDFDATGAVTGGNILAFSQVGGDAQGAITLGDITVGPGVPQGDDFSVGIASETSITVGDVSGTDRVGFATLGDLVTGDLSASDLVMTLVGGDISTGSITTQPDGTVYMGHASMFIDAGGGEDNFDASLVLALDPVPTGGSITINGDVSTGTFRAAAGNNLTTGAIDADLIQALAGGLASINGIWSAPFIELWSDDIEIGANGGMDGGSDGLIHLVSTNATQALIGDGLTGTGYALSNAEFGRLSAGNVQIAARGDASAAIDMLIGDLSVTGPSAGSTIEDPLGALVFATGDPETQVAGGVIRIVGDLTATGFGSDNAIEFYTGRFELDAATGLLEITSDGANLSGELYIEADRIHVASGEILDQLAIDPHYAGYQEDLNAPAEVQRPDGVIRAGGIDIFPTEAVLVQNTGTAETPAGFLTFGEGPLFSESDTPLGPIELIINGQLITEGGTLTGIDVRDFLIDDANIGIFTENSTINGCPLTGECGVVEPPEPPIPPGFTPTPGIQQEIVLINDNLLPPPEFGNEDFIDDNDEETDDGSTSPIEPPDPLFDTSELGEEAKAAGTDVGTSMRSNPGLTEPGDVDDPVSGSGNPGLIEKPVTPPSKEEKQP